MLALLPRRNGLRRIATQQEHLLIDKESLGCDTLQLGSQKAKCNAHPFDGQTHAQMPSELTKDVCPAPEAIDSGASTVHQYCKNWMVPVNENRDITADVDASDRGETMQRLSLVILHDTNRTSLTATVIWDGDAAADIGAKDLGQTMEQLPMEMLHYMKRISKATW